MKNSRVNSSIVIISIFFLEFLVSQLFFKDLFLFNWTSHYFYWHIWVLALLFVYFRKMISAYFIVIGNTIGILIGQFVGDALRNKNMLKITTDMSVEEKYHLGHHPGVEIWLMSIIVFLIISFIISRILKKRET